MIELIIFDNVSRLVHRSVLVVKGIFQWIVCHKDLYRRFRTSKFQLMFHS